MASTSPLFTRFQKNSEPFCLDTHNKAQQGDNMEICFKILAYILTKANIDPNIRTNELTDENVSKIREIIEADYQVESDLRRKVSLNIKRLSEINCTRGKRHRQQLPLRGQRTRTNARSRRGAKKTVAGKKK